MFSHRPLNLFRGNNRKFTYWIAGFGYKTKWFIVVCLLIVLSFSKMPLLFAQQLQETLDTTKTNIQYRIINITSSDDNTLDAQGLDNNISSTDLISGSLSQLGYSDTGSCIWDFNHMQRTGLTIYSGDYISGGLLSGNGSLDVSSYTGNWSGFNTQSMSLASPNGVIIHKNLLMSHEYLTMRDCERTSGLITYPTEQEYLSGGIMIFDPLLPLPPLFTGVTQIIDDIRNNQNPIIIVEQSNNYGGSATIITPEASGDNAETNITDVSLVNVISNNNNVSNTITDNINSSEISNNFDNDHSISHVNNISNNKALHLDSDAKNEVDNASIDIMDITNNGLPVGKSRPKISGDNILPDEILINPGELTGTIYELPYEIVTSKKEFANLINLTIMPKRQTIIRSRDSGKINKLEFTKQVIFQSIDKKLSAKIDQGSIIFTAQGQEINQNGFILDRITQKTTYQENKDPNKTENYNKDIIEFGTPGDHLIFSKPVLISIDTDYADGTIININVKHAGNNTYVTQGLSIDPNTACDLDGNATISSSQTTVQSGQVVFYTCGASSFALGYVPGLASPNASVTTIREQADGKMLIGGSFTTLGGVTRNRIARLNADKSLDTTFDPNLNNTVSDIKLQDDGKILVGGTFTTVGGVTRNRIARLNADGSLDTSFDPNISSTVNDIEIQSDGKIVIGGAFALVGGTSRSRIARLNADGTLDISFNPNANNTVVDITIQYDNSILLGGSFTTVGGVTRNRIARLNTDGTLDTTFDPNMNNTVNDIKIQSDNSILLGGSFTTLGGVTRNRIARLNADGSLDATFDPDISNTVNTLAIQANGQILIGGSFASVGGVTRSRIARVSSAGVLDLNFNPNANTTVSKIMVLNSDTIVIGGSFTSLGGVSQRYLAYYQDTVFDTTNNIRPSSTVNVLATQPDGKILFGGAFTTVGGTSRSRIARLNSNGSLDTSFSPNVNGVINTESLMLQSDGKIVIGGAFTGVDGAARNRIARLNTDGTLDTSFNPNANNQIQGIDIQSDGKIVIGGDFTTIGGVARNRIARLNTDGTLDTSFNPNASSTINVILTQPDGKIIIGGSFTTIGGVARNRIARLNTDGTLDTSFNPNANNIIQGISLQKDGKIIIGGSFTTIGGVTRNRIARLNTDGSLDTSFNPNANNIVHRIYVLPTGDMIIGGQFTTLGGVSGTNLAKIDINGMLDTSFTPILNNTVYALTQDQYNNVYFGGAFTRVNGNANNAYLSLIGLTKSPNEPRLRLSATSLTSLGDGDKVGTWKNFGVKSDATQNSSTNQPIIRKQIDTNLVNNINFNPVVQFNGTNQFMNVTGGLLANDTLGDAYVYVVSSSTPATQLLFYENTGSPYTCPYFGAHVPRTDNYIYWDAGDCGNSRVYSYGGGVANKPYLWSLGKSTTNTPQNTKQDIRRNGLTLTTSASTNPMVGNNSNFYLGSSSPSSSFFTGTIAEIMIYMGSGGTIDKTQQHKIESYLSIKYGMTLDQSSGGQNYVLTNGLVSWSTGSAGIYNNDIAGIIRDDDVGLVQTKSQSINNIGDIIIIKSGTIFNDTSLVWAHNNGSLGSLTTAELGSGLVSTSRIAREWKLQQKNGNMGLVTVTYPILGGSLSGGQAYMLVDSDGDFSNGGTTEITGSLVGGKWLFDASFNNNDVITFGVKPIVGIVTIKSPELGIFTGTTTNTTSSIEYQFDYFSITDTKGINSGYYTTLSLSSLNSSGDGIIPTTAIQRKAEPIIVLSGSVNPRVMISTGIQSYILANTLTTFIKRDSANNSNIKGQYGSKLWIKAIVSSYQQPGIYTGTITYTLYEN